MKKKPILLYFIITILAIALAALGVLTFLSMTRLTSLRSEITRLSENVEEISAASQELAEKAQALEALPTPSGEENTAEPEPEPEPEPQEEGTLSPSRGESFTNSGIDENLNKLMNQVQNLLPANNGSWSVYVCNLQNGSEAALNQAPMQAASLIKLFIMGAVYENYDALSQQYGAETLDANLSPMITVSDNDAANNLVSYLGGGDSAAGMNVVNQFCQAHGFTETSMRRLLLASNEYGDNYTSVYDCGRFMKSVYQAVNGQTPDIPMAGAESMYNLLNQQTRRNKIPAQMPQGVGIANKTGELANVENDAGIIYNTAKGVDLVICFMSENLNDTAAAQASIAQNSRAIYGYYNE